MRKELISVIFILIITLVSTSIYGSNLPHKYDARADSIVTPSKDQGDCNVCWAFSCVGALESHLIKFGLADYDIDLSEQQLISCNVIGSNCDGGTFDAIYLWTRHGPCYEKYFPFCGESECIEEYPELNFRICQVHTVDKDVEKYKDSIFIDGPACLSFNHDELFDSFWLNGYNNQIYKQKNKTTGYHTVLLIGWDDKKNAFLCKNSWGEFNGPNRDGTFWLSYSSIKNTNMINFDVNGYREKVYHNNECFIKSINN